MAEQQTPSKNTLIASGGFFVLLGLVVAGLGLSELGGSESAGATGAIIFGLVTAGFAVWITSFAIKKTEEREKANKHHHKTAETSEEEYPSATYTASGGDFMSSVGGIIVIIIVIGLGWLAWDKLVVPGYEKYVKKYDKPWWSGTEAQQVCGTGENQSKCYTLQVSSDGEAIDTITFPNGGYLYGDSVCYKAAEGLYSFDRFCRFWDQEGRQWDVNPL
jgi:hypothetical protein